MSRIYLANKLFNVNDRLASLDLCEAVDSWVDSGELPLTEHCFLPYRDSNNAIPPGGELGQQIFDLDVENMRNSAAIAGYYDGPVYDSGMGFEIGFMWTMNKPSVMATTDYYQQTIGNGREFVAISKYLQYIATVIQEALPDEGIEDYRAQCLNIRNKAWARIKAELQTALPNGTNFDPSLNNETEVYDFYLDPNFKYYESGREILNQLTAEIERLGKTYVVGDNQNDIALDIRNLAKSHTPIMYIEEFDADVDSSLIQGIAYGLGKRTVMFSTKAKQLINGDYIFNKNPMILYSGFKQLATSLDELLGYIRA